MSFFISEALADSGAAAAQQGSIWATIAPLAVFVVIFYFLLWRPQNKRNKEHKNLIETLKPGDEIVSAGGLLGRVTKVTDEFVAMEIADKVEIRIQKSSVVASLPKGTIKSI
ncbi:MAG TPA: preprotein translocase subunit YajC [Pseudomonadales bacterium]|nr:preprotein translocase subunit YajC [Pseudomonadales bacterium]